MCWTHDHCLFTKAQCTTVEPNMPIHYQPRRANRPGHEAGHCVPSVPRLRMHVQLALVFVAIVDGGVGFCVGVHIVSCRSSLLFLFLYVFANVSVRSGTSLTSRFAASSPPAHARLQASDHLRLLLRMFFCYTLVYFRYVSVRVFYGLNGLGIESRLRRGIPHPSDRP